MVKPPDLRAYLDEWPFDAKDNVRKAYGSDGRALILVRTPAGLEEYECDGRPDGHRVHGMASAFDFHHARIATAAGQADAPDPCDLSAGDCTLLVHEAAAYHHRMLLLFRLRDWARVERDTARTLRLIEFIRLHARHEEDRVQLEPWRPGVTRIHAVAKAMFLLEKDRHRDACEIAFSMGIFGTLQDGAHSNGHLAELLIASVRTELVEHPVDRLHEEATFHRQDDYWVVAYHGQHAMLKDSRGMHCLALLLRHPGREFHVSEFFALLLETSHPPAAPHTNGRCTSSDEHLVTIGLFEGDAVLDAQAKGQIKIRLSELREEHTEAEQKNDPHRAAKARDEMEAIARHLASAIGLGSRDRKTSSDAERARCAVTKRIKKAVKKTAEAIPALGHHLAARIKTGYFCSYNPHPGRRVVWMF